MVNFPLLWKLCLDIASLAGGYEDEKIDIIAPNTELEDRELIWMNVDVEALPKAIGGDAVVVVDEETGEEDEMCCRGVEHPSVSALVAQLVWIRREKGQEREWI